MPAPRIFVSSTWYDLKYIRENLKFFIESLGYAPILSEEGDVFYDPGKNVQDACLAEVSSCQMFVLIIGGRFGSKYKNTDKSIVNKEFESAIENKVPVFSLVERSVYEQYRIWLANKKNTNIDENKIEYPSADSPKIFQFIEEVQNVSLNNAIVAFDDFENLRLYLRQQWASMMFNFLMTESQTKKVEDTLSAISGMSKKIEFITREIAKETVKPKAEIRIKIMDTIEKNLIWPLNSIKKYWKIPFTIDELIDYSTLDKLLKRHNFVINIDLTVGPEGDTRHMGTGVTGITDGNEKKKSVSIGMEALEDGRRSYKELHNTIQLIMKEFKITKENLLTKNNKKS